MNLNARQQQAIDKLEKLKVGALFMEMGTGKTRVAMDLVKGSTATLCVWVCPYSLKNEVKKEYYKWGYEFPIEIVGCESIGSSDRIYVEMLAKAKQNDTFCVVDESLTIKNADAKRTGRIIELGKHSKYRLILNGTPLSKNCMDLWSQMEFLSPKILNMSYRRFKNTFAEYYLRGRLKGLVKKQTNVEYLVSLIEPYIYDSNLELDKKKRYYDYYYPNDHAEECAEIKRDFLKQIEKGDFNFFILTTLLQKAYTASNSKQRIIEEITKQDGQFIVYVKFLDNVQGDCITGETPLAKRKEVLESFERGEIKVLYMTYGIGSYGLNLQFCNNIIFADQTFDYAQKIQAEARVYRIGQERDVNYYNLYCFSGLDAMIQKSLEKKTNLLDEIKKEIEREGEEKWLKSI